METPEQLIRRIAANYNFQDPDLLVATARQESGLNPLAVGDRGQSYGIFQEHSAGRGAGVPIAQRQDVAAATQRAIAEFNAIRQRNPTVDRGTWAALAQRPQDQQGYARSVNALLGGAPGQPGSLVGQGPALREGEVPEWYRAYQAGASESDLVNRPQPPPPAAAPDWYRQYLRAGGDGATSGRAGAPQPAAQPAGLSPVAGPVITHSGQPYWSFGGGPHAGVDISAKAGTPVRSPVAGTVVANLAAGQNPLGLSAGYGRAVAVRDGAGNVHVFGHGSPDFGYLPVGTPVGIGDVISTVGSPKTKLPGEATEGEHLHWEIRGGGSYAKQVDPEQWLRGQITPATNEPRQALTNPGQGTQGGAVPEWYRRYTEAGGR